MQQIADSVYVSDEYPYVTVGCIVGPTGVVAVDAPTLPGDALAWRREILEIAQGPIVYTALTDAHPHRLLCAALLEAPIVSSRPAYEQAADYSKGFWRNVVRRLKQNHPQEGDALSDITPSLPRILFNEHLTLHRAGVEVTMEPVAGAAPGSSWVKPNDTDVMFLGDTLVVERPPVMRECPDTKAWLDTLTSLRRPHHAGVAFVPGRGSVGDQSDTEPLSEYIRLARRRVRSLHRNEKPRDSVTDFVDELLSIFPLSDQERSQYRRRARNGLKRVYDELEPNQDGG